MIREATGWRTSTYTGGTGNCVEVGADRGAVVVRDTKNREAGAISVPPAAWRAFIATLDR